MSDAETFCNLAAPRAELDLTASRSLKVADEAPHDWQVPSTREPLQSACTHGVDAGDSIFGS
jgi:hypothetical protein